MIPPGDCQNLRQLEVFLFDEISAQCDVDVSAAVDLVWAIQACLERARELGRETI